MKSWCTGAKSVLDWYDDNAQTAYFSIWNGRQLVGSWNDDNREAGRDSLERNLTAFEQHGMSDVFTLKLHPSLDKSNFATDKTPIYGSLNFRPCNPYEISTVAGVPGAPVVFPNNAGMQTMLEEIRALRTDVNELRSGEEAPATGWEAAIHGLLNSPDVQRTIAGYIPAIIKKVLPGVEPMPAGALGAVQDDADQNEKIDAAIDILVQYDQKLGDDLMILAKLAQSNMGKFSMALEMLRSNG